MTDDPIERFIENATHGRKNRNRARARLRRRIERNPRLAEYVRLTSTAHMVPEGREYSHEELEAMRLALEIREDQSKRQDRA